jgi:DNA gyrase subunit A
MENEEKKNDLPVDEEDEDETKHPNDPNEESLEEAEKEKGAGINGAQEGITGGIEDVEMGPVVKDSFLDYAMSVIVARALPEAKDGFKPVQRRIIYGMDVSGNTPDKPFKKSARIVGDVMGKYHPHGDSAIYGAMAHLAQDFATRYPLVEGHGNYGSQDGDEPAAMRYTEARLSKIAMEMVGDLWKNTVAFVDTYDGEGKEPMYLPSKIPNLIVNGATGIAVGMATNIPPHNLVETINAVQALIKNPELTPVQLMDYIHGPDFPGGGVILGKTGIKNYFETGQGTVVVRGKYDIKEEKTGKQSIVFTEIPYMVNKKELAKKIMDLCDNKTIDGISSVNDYSSQKDGTKFEIELKKGANAQIIVNHLFKYTALQDTFPVNMLALDSGVPKILNMKQALNIFIKFQEDIVERRTRFDLQKAKDRLHILEALKLVHDNIDEVVHIIRSSANDEESANRLKERFAFDDVQTKAVLDMPLKRLNGLEIGKITGEMEDLNKDIIRYNDILGNFELLKQVVLDELEETKKKYGDERRTELSNAIFSEDDEDLVPNEEILIMLTESGYIKRVNPDEFKVQNRGGIGVIGMETKEDDVVSEMIHARTKVDILFFTNLGKVYRVRGYQIPEGTRTSKGVPAVNIVKLENGEKILTILPAEKYDEQHYFFFTTVNGVVKRTRSDEFENINSNGKIAIGLKEGDSLVDVKYTDGTALISLASSKGKVCTFHEDDVRSMGRTAAGVRGMNLDGGKVVGVCTDKGGNDILTLSANGYGKRSDYSEFRITNRGSKGVKALNVSEKSGDLVMIKAVKADEKIVIITDGGTTMKTEINDIHEAGRATLGVKVITLKEGENISSVSIELSDAEFQELANEKTIAESGDSEGAVSEKSVENYVNGTGRNDDDSSEDDSGSSDKSDE